MLDVTMVIILILETYVMLAIGVNLINIIVNGTHNLFVYMIYDCYECKKWCCRNA